MLLDFCRALWIVGIFSAVFVLFPARLSLQSRNRPWGMWIAACWVRMALSATLVVALLAKLKVLTTIILMALLCLGAAIAWLRQCDWVLANAAARLQGSVLRLVSSIEARWSSLRDTLQPRDSKLRREQSSTMLSFSEWAETVMNNKLKTGCFVVVFLLMGVLQWGRVLLELRFVQPDQYIVLMHARELILNLNSGLRPLIFPAVVTVTSLISGADPLQVTRFLSPLTELSVVLCLGLLVNRFTRFSAASLVAMYCVGVAAFPPLLDESIAEPSTTQKLYVIVRGGASASVPPTIEFELGLVFLLLALIFLADWFANSQWSSLFDTACCMVLVGIASEFLLFILLTLSVVLLFRPKFVLPAFFLVATGCAIEAAIWAYPAMVEAYSLMPVAAAVGVSCLIALTSRLVSLWKGARTEAALLLAFMAIAIFCFPPHAVLEQPLEYESAAQNTRKIAYQFPREKWLLVAPVEQLPETLGLGAYYDLAFFVEEYRNQVEARDFRFSENMEDVFIYVEKTPFQVFLREPASVSFSVLTDATYRNYRSPAGRASLESAALQLCENYRKHHLNAEIYFEDENLRIYHVHQALLMPRKETKGSIPNDSSSSTPANGTLCCRILRRLRGLWFAHKPVFESRAELLQRTCRQ